MSVCTKVCACVCLCVSAVRSVCVCVSSEVCACLCVSAVRCVHACLHAYLCVHTPGRRVQGSVHKPGRGEWGLLSGRWLVFTGAAWVGASLFSPGNPIWAIVPIMADPYLGCLSSCCID